VSSAGENERIDSTPAGAAGQLLLVADGDRVDPVETGGRGSEGHGLHRPSRHRLVQEQPEADEDRDREDHRQDALVADRDPGDLV